MSLCSRSQYIDFLRQYPANYYTISIADGSLWILRLGELENTYTHIHPGRYSPHTLRVKAGALKTAIATHVWMQMEGQHILTLQLLNQARKEVLNASPVKSLDAMIGFAKIYQVVADSPFTVNGP